MNQREKILKEIDFFGGKDFDKRKEVDLTDEGELAATLKLAQLSGYDIAIQEVCKVLDKRIKTNLDNIRIFPNEVEKYEEIVNRFKELKDAIK